MATYSEKLRDPRWQKRRLHMLQAAGWECGSCGNKEKTLNVHHKQYRKGADPWDYQDDELAVLCESCHEQEHHSRNRLNEALCYLPAWAIDQVAGYACAMAADPCEFGASAAHSFLPVNERFCCGVSDYRRGWFPPKQEQLLYDWVIDNDIKIITYELLNEFFGIPKSEW